MLWVKNRLVKLLSAIALGGCLLAGVFCITTSCSRKQLVTINENISAKYLVQEDQTIWVSGTMSITSGHNKFLDLNKWAHAHHNNATSFIVRGTIDFGILVNFNENVNLYGANDSTIKLGSTDSPLNTSAIGILVGSVNQPSIDQGAYQGKMIIDPSVNVTINSSIEAYGLFCFGSDTGSIMEIAGSWNISSTGIARGVSFAGINAPNSLQIIFGTFYIVGSDAIGVEYVDIDQDVDANSLDIHGNFYIYASSSTGHAIGVFLGNTEAGQLYDIEGSFSIRSEYIGIGVAIAQDAGHMSIDGIFAIEAVQPIGVQVENISGDYALLVDAHFALYNTNPDTSTRYTKGISSSLAFNKLTTNSDTKFYSNDVNSGYIPSDNADTNSYYWNDVLISKDQQTTTADPILTLTTISSTNNEFSIAIIATQEGLINEFNQHYAQELILYSTSNWCSWLIKQWLIEIISQIH